jgi:hypothetical protein
MYVSASDQAKSPSIVKLCRWCLGVGLIVSADEQLRLASALSTDLSI